MRSDEAEGQSLNRFLLASILIHALLFLLFPSWLYEMSSGASLQSGGVVEVIPIAPRERVQQAPAPRMPQPVRPPSERRPRPEAPPVLPQPVPAEAVTPQPERPVQPTQPPVPPEATPPVEPEPVPAPAPVPPEPAPREPVPAPEPARPAPETPPVVQEPVETPPDPVPVEAPPAPAEVMTSAEGQQTVAPAPAPPTPAPAPAEVPPVQQPQPVPQPQAAPEPVMEAEAEPEPVDEAVSLAEAEGPPVAGSTTQEAAAEPEDAALPDSEPRDGAGSAEDAAAEEELPPVRGSDMVAFGGELIYPKTAQDRGYTGTVVVEVAVDGSTGSATDVRLVQGTGQPSLDEAALLYITHRARFERASSDYIVQVEIHYNRNVGSGGRSTYEVVIVTRDRVVFVP